MFLKNVLDQTGTTIIINSHILAGIYLILLKFILDQSWKSLKTEFRPQQKYRKKSFCNIVFLISCWCCVKGLMVNKFIKGIRFEGAWSELEAKNSSYRKLFPKIVSFKPFGNSWGYWHIPRLPLIKIKICFTCGVKKIWKSNKNSQNIMFLVAA